MSSFSFKECSFLYSINLLKTKHGAYVINFNEYKSIGTHWIGFYGNAKNITYFDSYEIDYNLKEIRKLIENENVKTNISRFQTYHSIICEAYNLIICGCFCIGFLHFMLKRLKFARLYKLVFSKYL